MTTTKQSARGNVSQFTRWTADSGRIGSLSMATKTSSPPISSSQLWNARNIAKSWVAERGSEHKPSDNAVVGVLALCCLFFQRG